MHNLGNLIAPATVVLALGLASPALAQDNSIGMDAYNVTCAVCHGSTGQGDGEFADVLTVKPPDLTKLAANNDGVFPFLKVFQTVDGRASNRAHGSSDMPIWGNYYTRQVGDAAGVYGTELYVRAHIVALVDYVESLQK